MKLTITKQEQEIFDMILSCKPSNVVPRVAGGWVRDKIMGKSSYDLDIALDNISGYDFAVILEHSFRDSVSSVSIIQNNPDKSKHLETAVCTVNGLSIDFVHLRNETYTNSRIPKITLGTAVEDAFRRDLTVNALFYNIFTKEIEDYTGKGIQDIKDKILRTPLEPLITFSDDPLRILRLFRFKSKLNFQISPEIFEALNNADLKKHLRNKVSKERVYIEIFKMINYQHGYKGIYEIIRNKFVETVFDLKVNYDRVMEFYNKLNSDTHIEENKWIYNLYIIFLDTSCKMVKDKKKLIFMNVLTCRDNLCCPSKICKIIQNIEEGMYLCRFLDFKNYSIYNICYIYIVLGKYYLEILYLQKNKESNDNIMNFLNFIQSIKLKIVFKKLIIEIKDIHIKLGIEKKFIKYFVKEMQIYQFAYPENDIFKHLLENKQKIIDKFEKLKVPHK